MDDEKNNLVSNYHNTCFWYYVDICRCVWSFSCRVCTKESNKNKCNTSGKQATKIINQTSIPANKTTTTIQKKTESVGKVPLPSNQTKLSPPGSQAKLPPVSNKTTTTPTGKATTTIINKTNPN